MKKSSRRRPELEPLESMTLLTTIVPAAITSVGHSGIQPGGPIQLASTTKVQVVGLSSPISSTSSGPSSSTHRPVVVGLSVAPTSSSQTTHRTTVVSFGSISTPLGKSPTVHAMIVPGSTPAITKPTSHAIVVAGPPIKVATQVPVNHATLGLKVS